MSVFYNYRPQVKKDTYFDVFLGGTTFKDESMDWRREVERRVNPNIRCFNPIVEEWDEYQRKVEENAKANSKYKLYVLTPQMRGVYSIAEMMLDSVNCGENTLICVLPEYKGKKFSTEKLNSLNATLELCRKYNATILYTLDGVIEYLNSATRRQ